MRSIEIINCENQDLIFLAITAFATGFGIFFNDLLPLADVRRFCLNWLVRFEIYAGLIDPVSGMDPARNDW
jgi:hypothetical protein